MKPTKIPCLIPNAKIILGGDFNSPGIDWQTGTFVDSYISTFLRETLIEIADDYQLLLFQLGEIAC